MSPFRAFNSEKLVQTRALCMERIDNRVNSSHTPFPLVYEGS